MTRQCDLAKIHIACKDLGLSKDDRAYIIANMTRGRTDSAANLNKAERQRLLVQLRSKGWQPKRPQHKPLVKKIHALWLYGHEIGAIRDPRKQALQHFAQRHINNDDWKQASNAELNRLVETLKALLLRDLMPVCYRLHTNLQAKGSQVPAMYTQHCNSRQRMAATTQAYDDYYSWHQALLKAHAAIQTH